MGEKKSLYEPALILTVRMDEQSQGYFNSLRALHFPPERNFLKAHLTVFHKLPDAAETLSRIGSVALAPFTMQVTGLISLGRGVAFRVESEMLRQLRSELVALFKDGLSDQESQGFRGHITVSNKIGAGAAAQLLGELSGAFRPFEVRAFGLDLWRYLGGPWERWFYRFRVAWIFIVFPTALLGWGFLARFGSVFKKDGLRVI